MSGFEYLNSCFKEQGIVFEKHLKLNFSNFLVEEVFGGAIYFGTLNFVYRNLSKNCSIFLLNFADSEDFY